MDNKNQKNNKNNNTKTSQETINFVSEEVKRGCCSKCQITHDKSECPKGDCS